MLPEIWGKCAWNLIHLVTLDYPENPSDIDKQNYYDFFYSLRYILPCAKCRNNLSNHLKKYPLTNEILSNRADLIKWGIDLHNIVNYYTGKPMLTYPEAMNEINKMVYPKKNFFNKPVYLLLLLIIFIVVCYLFYYYIKKCKKLNI